MIEVHAATDVILERVARRAVQTGRDVPRDEVLDSIARVPKSLIAC